MQFYKNQKVKCVLKDSDTIYYGKVSDTIYYGKVTKAFYRSNLPGGAVVSVLWDTGREHDYLGSGKMLRHGMIKPASSLPKNNPNRRFVEDEKKI